MWWGVGTGWRTWRCRTGVKSSRCLRAAVLSRAHTAQAHASLVSKKGEKGAGQFRGGVICSGKRAFQKQGAQTWIGWNKASSVLQKFFRWIMRVLPHRREYLFTHKVKKQIIILVNWRICYTESGVSTQNDQERMNRIETSAGASPRTPQETLERGPNVHLTKRTQTLGSRPALPQRETPHLKCNSRITSGQ